MGVEVLLAEEQILAPTVHLLTDAAKGKTSRGLDGLALFPDGTPSEAWMVSDAARPQTAVPQTIMELELVAAYATVRAHLQAHPTFTNTVLHVDNTAARFALVKGRTRNPRLGKNVTAHHTLPDRARARVYVAYTNTDRNTADARSRLAFFHDMCVLRGPFVQLHANLSDLLSMLAEPTPSRSPIARDSDTDSSAPRD